jgi:LEA14-like dessication related protein
MRRLLPLLAVIAAACSHRSKPPPPPAPLPIVAPVIAFEAVKVDHLEFSGADLLFRARIENSNPFPLSVVRVEYALQLGGRPAASGTAAQALVIPATDPAVAPATAPDPAGAPGTGQISLPVRLRYSGLVSVLKDREAAYVLGGAVVFSTPSGEVAIPLSHSGTVVVPRLPAIKVERAFLRKASAREVTVEVQLAVHNPNAFPIPAGRIGYGLFLSDKEVVRADLEIAAPIGGGESASVGAPVRISVLKAGKAAARLLIPFSSLDIKLKGEAVFGGVPVPLDLGASMLPGP